MAGAGTTAVHVGNGAKVQLDSASAISGTFTNAVSVDANIYTFANIATLGAVLTNRGSTVVAIP